jgi:hypothetical protein
LPTPVSPGPHPRLFAESFEGSTTTTDRTLVFDSPDIVSGFAAAGYHTVCVGGLGCFNKLNPLGSVLPELFAESHWCPAFGVTDPGSTKNQVDFVLRRFSALQKRAPVLCVICSDHGTAYGEGGYRGHRLSHLTVWDVPYAEFVLPEIRS